MKQNALDNRPDAWWTERRDLTLIQWREDFEAMIDDHGRDVELVAVREEALATEEEASE